MKQDITTHIEQLMAEKGLNMTQLGQKLGFGGTNVNQLNRAKKMIQDPRISELPKLEKALGVSQNEILFGQNKQVGTGNVAGSGNKVHITNENNEKTALLTKILSIKDPEERKLALQVLKSN